CSRQSTWQLSCAQRSNGSAPSPRTCGADGSPGTKRGFVSSLQNGPPGAAIYQARRGHARRPPESRNRFLSVGSAVRRNASRLIAAARGVEPSIVWADHLGRGLVLRGRRQATLVVGCGPVSELSDFIRSPSSTPHRDPSRRRRDRRRRSPSQSAAVIIASNTPDGVTDPP